MDSEESAIYLGMLTALIILGVILCISAPAEPIEIEKEIHYTPDPGCGCEIPE